MNRDRLRSKNISTLSFTLNWPEITTYYKQNTIIFKMSPPKSNFWPTRSQKFSLWTQLFLLNVFTIIFTIFSNHSPRIGPRLCGWLSISEVSICSNFEPATYSIPSNMTQFSITRRRSTTCCSSQALTRNRAK